MDVTETVASFACSQLALLQHVTCPVACDLLQLIPPHPVFSPCHTGTATVQIGSHSQGDGLRCGWSAPVLSAGLFGLPCLFLGDLFDLLCSAYTVCLSDYLFLSFYKDPKVIFKNQII